MAYPIGNAPFVDDGVYAEDYGDDDSYEPDLYEKTNSKPTRKSTKGRKLKRWDGESSPGGSSDAQLLVINANNVAADEDQKLLLYIDYVCAEQGVFLPWDAIAATMEPRDATKGEKPMTGEAIKQHLAKLRDHRDGKGLDVPPKLDRNTRRSVAGKNMPQTPAPTPRKSSGYGGGLAFPKTTSGRGKAQAASMETPIKKEKESSLLAPVSKSKQKKAEKAKRLATLGNGSGDLPASTSRGGKADGGTKVTTGKRGRRPAAAAAATATEDDCRGDTAKYGAVPGRQSRHPERKDYTGMAPDFAAIGIKAEPESEDDLPLSKRRTTGTKLGGRKKPAVSLMGDTVQMWQNRNAQSAIGERAADTPQVEQSIEEDVDVPSHGKGNHNDQRGTFDFSQATVGESPNDADLYNNGSSHPKNAQLTQTTVSGVPNDRGLAFHPVNYQVPGFHGPLGQQFGGDRFGIGFSHPSPMDINFMEFQEFGRPPGIYAPPYSHDYMGLLGNDLPLTSSPVYDSLSSATLPGSHFHQSFGSDYSRVASMNTSTNSSLSNHPGLSDPFAMTDCSGNLVGLPTIMNNWSAPSNQTSPQASFNGGHQHSGYTDNQVSPDYFDVDPTLAPPASGLGLGISHSNPHSVGSISEPSTETKRGHGLPANPYVNHPETPDLGVGMGMCAADLDDPHNQLFGMDESVDNDDFLAQLPING
jgi:hypothetical protein